MVVAAGSSSRFGRDKLRERLGGRTVLELAVAALRTALPGAPVVLVLRPDRAESERAHWAGQDVLVVAGGELRQDSVRNGVEALAPGDEDLVLIHDGARPFVPVADVGAVVSAAARHGAAILAAEISDTVKRVDPDGVVVATVPRERLVRSLTPQVFSVRLLRRSWAAALHPVWTDEAALLESLGDRVATVAADPRNVKVTRPEDLEVLEGVVSRRVRVGQGVDVHPFAPGRPMVLCGVELPSDVGLAGHSDADAALHALADAILGGCGRGDIGEHFPPSDERWRGVASEVFVRRAVELAAEAGWRVTSCDLNLLAERPRIAPHRAAMRARLAALLDLELDDVGLQATTCEGMGFVGRSEGLVAMAVVTLEQR